MESALARLESPQPHARPMPAPSSGSESRLLSFWILGISIFVLALCMWWVLFQYRSDPAQNYGLGFWIPDDRPGWLPRHSFGPLLGHHYFGDWFQLYYLIHSGKPYTGHIFHTALNPGYLLPAYLTSWLPYKAAGFSYLALMLIAWFAPSVLVYRRSRFGGLLYLAASTLSVPGLMALDLGQPQVFVYLFGLLALYYFLSDKRRSSVMLGLSMAIKPYMALFVLVYLARGHVRDGLRSLYIGLGVNLVMAFALVRMHALSVAFWTGILKASLSYGSGSNLAIWGNGGFLRADSSLFGLLATLSKARVAGVSSVARAIGGHYLVVSLLLLIGGVVWFWWKRRSMRISMQWLYLTILLLIVPSYSLGYAWMLLLVPFVVHVLPSAHGFAPWQTRPGRHTTKRAVWACALVFLAIVPYPSNIQLPHYTAQFGPNGNTIATPLLLLSALVLLTLSRRRVGAHSRSDRPPAPNLLGEGDQNGLSGARIEEWALGLPLALGVALQIGVLVLCHALSS